jgi:hypothetical protein
MSNSADSLMPVLMVVGGIGLVGLLIWAAVLAHRAEQARIEGLYQFALENGFEFSRTGLSSENNSGFWETLMGQGQGSEESRFIGVFSQFEPFGKGHSQEVSHLITGRKETIDWYFFDYTYKITTSNGKSTSTTTYRNGMFAIRVPFLFPTMSLSQESFLHRVGEFFGSREVEFESDDFNRRYFVKSSDEKATYDLIHPQMMDYLMSIPVLNWQMSGPFLMIYQTRYLTADDIRSSMQIIEGFLQQIPGFLQEDRGFQASWESPLDQMR